MDPTSDLDLSKVLTPALYDKLLRIQFPWEGPVDMSFASKYYFEGEPDCTSQVYEACYQAALKPLSTYVPQILDLKVYLPHPSARNYPEQTVALLLLLDQAPRTLFSGMNKRYTNAFFDLIGQKLVRDLISAGTLPASTSRWTSLGYGFEDAMIRKFWLYGPLIHSQNLADQDLLATEIEAMRVEIEEYSGKKDPYRKTRHEDAKDVFLFARLLREEIPETFAEFFFWMLRVFDAHRPIIAKFGRSPHSNVILGRDSTEEELEYLNDKRNFPPPKFSEDQIKKLKEQNKNGTWDKLDDEQAGGSRR